MASMEPIRRVYSKTVVIAANDVDTDQILPARFLTTTTKEGLGAALFAEWRYLPDGAPNPSFPLNYPTSQHAKILVAGRNFGAGSSREHAPWAMLDYGFRAVISTQIADIFRTNCLKNGLLPVLVDESTAAWLLKNPGADVDIDLESLTVTLPTGQACAFDIEPFSRHCLLNGIDELGYLRGKISEIEKFEAEHNR
jgi:3-isopropylmalate/(R)-2-methylmalate dehydratase small subunit